MCRYAIAILALALFLPPAMQAQAKSEDGAADKKASVPTITVTRLDISDKALNLSYEIRNSSQQDIWVCGGFNSLPGSFEVQMAMDGETLLIRRRFDVPMEGYSPALPSACYVRLRKGDTREESLLLSLPVRPYRVLWGGRRTVRVIEHATSLMLEIDFYSGDLPGMIFGLLEEVENDPQKKHVDDRGYPTDVIGWLNSSVYFNSINEGLQDREEQVIVPWTKQTLKGARVIRAMADDVNIPYLESVTPIEFRPQDLNLCTRIEITYQPSMLEYLFPYPSQQNLLNADEAKYLASEKKVVFGDRQSIRVLTDELSEGAQGGTIAVEPSKRADVVCYDEGKRLIAFTSYHESAIVIEEGQCFCYRDGLQSIKTLTSQIKQATPFRLRVDCAANLRRLWYRLRLYHEAKQTRYTDEGMTEFAEPIRPEYPVPNEWCDSMLQAYVPLGGSEAYVLDAHKCPGAGKGKNHYAMNPNCKPDSPVDAVLLFETKAGWNQHGGPELFTFDNHDPKGGCVLLNDGTVKFVRTKEELQQLRWR